MRKYWLAILLMGLQAAVYAQQPKAFTLLRFTPKKGTFSAKENDYEPGKKGFYLYENCIYTLLLGEERQYNARIIHIKKKTVLFLPHLLMQQWHKSKKSVTIHLLYRLTPSAA